jgi:hypothetical protein
MIQELITVTALLTGVGTLLAADKPSSPRQALQPFNVLIGSWKGTGTPEGSREERQRGFWVETLTWEWQFKGDDAWLRLRIDKGKHYTAGELRWLRDSDTYRLVLTTLAKDKVEFVGRLVDNRLTLDHQDETKKEKQRLVMTLLHANRFLYRFESQGDGKPTYARLYQVGATKEGVPFAAGDTRPVCIVSGGVGTMPVTYKGKTYYVCCTGCRDAFQEDPERYVKEFEAKKDKSAQ